MSVRTRALLALALVGAIAAVVLHAGEFDAASIEASVRALGPWALGMALLAAVAFLPRLVKRLRAQPAAAGPDWIDVAELAACLDGRELAIIDVRGADEFDGPLGHIDGARNVPLDVLKGQPQTLDAQRGHPLVLACRTDRRSAVAAQILHAAGHRRLRVLRGGMEAWNRAGLAVLRTET